MDERLAGLDWTAQQGHVDVVGTLMEFSAGVNANDLERTTMLAVASMHADLSIVHSLPRAGAVRAAKGRDGRTASDLAGRRGQKPAVELLDLAVPVGEKVGAGEVGAVEEDGEEGAMRLPPMTCDLGPSRFVAALAQRLSCVTALRESFAEDAGPGHLAELERLFGMMAELNLLECDDAFPGSVKSGVGAPACLQIFHDLLEDARHEAVIEVQTIVTKTRHVRRGRA
jgi:hypothetical protein